MGLILFIDTMWEATFKVEVSFVMLKIKLGVNFSIFKRMAHLVTRQYYAE